MTPIRFPGLETGSLPFTRLAFAFLAGFAILYAATFLDPRLLNGVSVWEKPSKFFLSVGVHMATLGWGLSLLDPAARQSRPVRLATWLFMAAALFEMSYMIFRAARGEASHFNRETPVAEALYALMGLGALTLTGVTAYFGWRILRAGQTTMHHATGWSFLAAAIATTLVGGILSSGQSHWIGGDQSDATGLAFFHWSTTGGDLRVAHFAALHLMQAVPIIAWFWQQRTIVAVSLLGGLGAVGLLSAQALVGVPLFRI